VTARAQPRRRTVVGALILLGASCGTFLGGCASTPAPTAGGAAAAGQWTGRMALQIQGEPPQNFAALFDLRGNAQAGELRLTSPIGNTLGLARWSPGEAILQDGSKSRRFDSADDLLRAATGAAIPLDALFGWLAGQDRAVPGWRADLRQYDAGRINATRESPQPRADLRGIIDRP